jgi:membrane protein DedA with SNARE-associated domain
MLMATTTTLLLGMVLAQRFRVLVLVPAMLLILLIAGLAGIARIEPTAAVALTGILAIVGLQTGYLLGLGVRELIGFRRLNKQPSTAAERRLLKRA